MQKNITHVVLLACLFLTGCANQQVRLTEFAAANQAKVITSGSVDLPIRGILPQAAKNSNLLRVYIEGDGKAWITRTVPSSDPTPDTLVWADRAMRDPHPSVYLARPCQFGKGQGCSITMWTDRRFSQPVLDSYQLALDNLKELTGNDAFELIGYSGGGAIAMMLALTRDDVAAVQTVAGNLDPKAWAQYHSISELDIAMDIREHLDHAKAIDQYHFVGTSDMVVPASLTEDLVRMMGGDQAHVVRVPASHSDWSALGAIGRAEGPIYP